MVFTHTGKKQIAVATAILLGVPKPSHPIKSGARTILGRAWRAITYGVITRRTNGEIPSTVPSVNPAVLPSTKAASTAIKVERKCPSQ